MHASRNRSWTSCIVSAVALLAALGRPGPTLAQTIQYFDGAGYGITAGPDGNVWYAGGTKIGRVRPDGSITEFVATGPGTDVANIVTGPDGNLWFTIASSTQGFIGQITPAGAVTAFILPWTHTNPWGITAGPDGNVYYTHNDRIARIGTDGVSTDIAAFRNSLLSPMFITPAPDGNLWFTQNYAGRIGHIGLDGRGYTSYLIPSGATSNPWQITLGPDGALWFTERSNNRIGRIDMNGVITEFTLPAGMNAVAICTGPDGALWFTTEGTNSLSRMTTGGVVTQVGNRGGWSITTGPDGNIWFTSDTKIGKVNLIGPTVTGVSPANGPTLGGTPIAIAGSGFQTGATVKLGGAPATVTSVTPTLILATTGFHVAGVVEVGVTNPDYGYGELLAAYTYECSGAAPTASVYASGPTSVCAGQSTSVEARLTGTPPWSLRWSDGFQETGINTTPHIRAVSPATTTTYRIDTVADVNCAAAGSSFATVTITVKATPDPKITAPAAICVGASGTASVPDAGLGATYDWTIQGGTINSGLGTRTITFGATGPGLMNLGVTVGNGACTTSSSKDIPASMPPTATVSGGATICSGQSTPIQADLTGTPPWIVAWSDGVVQSGVQTSPATRTVTPAANTTYTVTAVSDAGCTGTSSGSAIVTVNPTPSASLTAPSLVCPGSTGNAASVPATAGATYTWMLGNGTITGGAGTNAITFTAGATGNVNVSVTVDLNNCPATSVRDVPIATPPTAVVSGGGTICAGTPSPIQVALTGTGPWQMTWSDGFVQTASSSPATRNVTPSAATTYSITSLRDASCPGSATGSAAFTVNALPTADVSGGATICPGDTAVITAQISGAVPISVQWSDGELMTNVAPGTITKTVKPDATTLYEVLLVTDANCSAWGSGGALVTVAPDAAAVLVTAPEGVCAGATGLHASIPNAGAGATYEWTITNGTITAGAGTNAVTFSAGASGSIALGVSLRLASGCGISGGKTIVVNPLPALPVIDAPAAAQTEQEGLVAQVASHTGSTYEWSIENGSITGGNGTSRIIFAVGEPGTTRLTVVEVSSHGCRSLTGRHSILVSGVTERAIVPVVLDVAGLGGARFTTELTLANPERVPAKVDLVYTAAEALGSTGSGVVHETLAPGQQLVIPDTLQYLRDKGLAIPRPRAGEGDTPSQGGSLGVAFRDVPVGSSVSAAARTTSPSGGGRAGLAYPATPVEDLTSASVQLFGLRQTAADRSNVALTNVGSASPVTLRVTLRSGLAGDTRKLILPGVTLAPGQWRQLNGVLSEAGFTNGWAQVDRVAGTEPFLAYAVFNDNATNDGSYVPAVPVERPAGLQLLPVLIESASFSSELILANPGTKKVDVSLSFAESLAHPGGLFSGTIRESLEAGEQRIIPDAIDYLRSKGAAIGARGAATYAGALSVNFAVAGVSARGFVGARTAAPSTIGGQYGLFYPGSTHGEMSTGSAWVFGLVQNSASRSNLAIVNGAFNMGPVTVRYEVFDGTTGAKAGASQPIPLNPGAWTQVNAVLSTYHLTNGYIRVTRTEGTAPLLVYAVVNDGSTPSSGTSDGSYISMSIPPK